MPAANVCDHEDLTWHLALNEDGWKCSGCDWRPGEPPGFSPQHDRDLLEEKVRSILFWMNEAGLLHVSNSDHGFSLTERAAEICRSSALYDQLSIVYFLVQCRRTEGNNPGMWHCNYWKRISDGVLAGNDPRERCRCGRPPGPGWARRRASTDAASISP